MFEDNDVSADEWRQIFALEAADQKEQNDVTAEEFEAIRQMIAADAARGAGSAGSASVHSDSYDHNASQVDGLT